MDAVISVRLFTGDALIYRIINKIEDEIGLQQELIRLELWATSWGYGLQSILVVHDVHWSYPCASCRNHMYKL